MTTVLGTAKLAGIAVASSAALACGSGGAGPSVSAATAARDSTATGSAASGVESARRAVSTAVRAVGHGRAFDIERDRRRGAAVWDVDVANPGERTHEVTVRADGRRVLQRRRDSHASRDARDARRAKVSLREALRIAARRSRGTFDEADIDRARGGRLVWSVTFALRRGAETEVSVDARTGKVVRVEHDRD